MMPLPQKNALRPDLLYLFVIGPCTGETVMIRVPPDQWMIIDSFKCGRPSRAAATSVIERFGGNVAVVALTHPHGDHFAGVVDLIDIHNPIVLACVHPRDSGLAGGVPTDAIALLKQGAKAAYTRIWDEWERSAGRQWATFRNTWRNLGNNARVTSLHPVRPLTPANWSVDLNAISSAMLLEWHDVRLLLGADVPNSEWPGIAAAFVALGNHSAMKVPHHGSREAIHPAFGNGLRTRFWVVTPFERQDLPRSKDTTVTGLVEGIASILSYVDEIKLTALPYRHDREADSPCRTTRPQVRDNVLPVRDTNETRTLLASNNALDRHVIVGFDHTGAVVDVHYGPGSLAITA